MSYDFTYVSRVILFLFFFFSFCDAWASDLKPEVVGHILLRNDKVAERNPKCFQVSLKKLFLFFGITNCLIML